MHVTCIKHSCTTLLRVLCCRFLTDIYSEAHPGPSLRLKKTVQVVNLQLKTTEDYFKVNKADQEVICQDLLSG